MKKLSALNPQKEIFLETACQLLSVVLDENDQHNIKKDSDHLVGIIDRLTDERGIHPDGTDQEVLF